MNYALIFVLFSFNFLISMASYENTIVDNSMQQSRYYNNNLWDAVNEKVEKEPQKKPSYLEKMWKKQQTQTLEGWNSQVDSNFLKNKPTEKPSDDKSSAYDGPVDEEQVYFDDNFRTFGALNVLHVKRSPGWKLLKDFFGK